MTQCPHVHTTEWLTEAAGTIGSWPLPKNSHMHIFSTQFIQWHSCNCSSPKPGLLKAYWVQAVYSQVFPLSYTLILLKISSSDSELCAVIGWCRCINHLLCNLIRGSVLNSRFTSTSTSICSTNTYFYQQQHLVLLSKNDIAYLF